MNIIRKFQISDGACKEYELEESEFFFLANIIHIVH
jgi:hypothetical protein